jgi:hypothetical protein
MYDGDMIRAHSEQRIIASTRPSMGSSVRRATDCATEAATANPSSIVPIPRRKVQRDDGPANVDMQLRLRWDAKLVGPPYDRDAIRARMVQRMAAAGSASQLEEDAQSMAMHQLIRQG